MKKMNLYKVYFKKGTTNGSPLVTNSISILLQCFDKFSDIIEKIEVNGKTYNEFPKKNLLKYLLGIIEK